MNLLLVKCVIFLSRQNLKKRSLLSTDHQGHTTIVAWSKHRNDMLFAKFDSTGSAVTYNWKHIDADFDNLYVADCNGDGMPDIILVNKREKLVSVVLDTRSDSLRVASTLKIPVEPEQLLIGDFNNDKLVDMLVYARKTPGILPLVGNGRGSFTVGKVIGQDHAVGAADLAHVNNDNLIDIILWDWVKSELHVLYGVGNGRFIDQSIFPVRGEVESLTAISTVRGHSVDLVMKMSKPSEFQVWEGNDFGDFQLKIHVPANEQVTDFCFADVNKDGLSDIVMATNPASLQVVFNNESDPFTDRIDYAAGTGPQTITVTSQGNCIVFDRGSSQFLTFRNTSVTEPLADSVQLATGVFPTGLMMTGLNRDSVMDIALLNTKSQSLSLYWGRKNRTPLGPVSYSLTDEPGRLAFHSSTDTTVQLVLTFPQTHQISYFTLNTSTNTVSNAFIGCDGDAQLISASTNPSHQSEFVTYNTNSSEGNSLSFYQQLGPTTFIERTFRLQPPDDLLGACIADLNHDGFPGIILSVPHRRYLDGGTRSGIRRLLVFHEAADYLSRVCTAGCEAGFHLAGRF